jgi:hypothetical protein
MPSPGTGSSALALTHLDLSVGREGVLAPGCGEQPHTTRQQCGARAHAEPREDALVLREPTQIRSDGRMHAHCLSLHEAEYVHVRLVGEDLRVGPLDSPE